MAQFYISRLSSSSSVLCLLFYIITIVINIHYVHLNNTVQEAKDVAVRDHLLLITTLDGSFHAISQRNGLIKWTIPNSPILQMSPLINVTDDSKQHHFLLPDPKDGTLYLFNGFSHDKGKHNHRTTLEKLPFTISELVSTSPCRSSDGMIYASKKVDEWIIVDVESGNKIDSINVDSPVCSTPHEPITNPLLTATHNLLHLFKSEYQISIFSSENREKIFNFTYIDYSPSMISSIAQSSYEFLHLTSSTNGKIATMDVTNGHNSFLWSFEFESPIVSIYRLSETANFPIIHRVPFFTIGGYINTTNFFGAKPNLFPSVYVGELSESKSLYALSALVEMNQIRKDSDYLIEGPLPPGKFDERFDLLKYLLGYYEYPKDSDIKFSVIPRTQLISNVAYSDGRSKMVMTDERLQIQDYSSNRKTPVNNDAVEYYTFWVFNFIILFLLLVIMAMLLPIFVKFYWDKRLHHRKTMILSTSNDNQISIGKITFNPSQIIGRGCAGTCVYKGLFEGKQQVAVKRIVSDCFRLANREIDLLRQLQHPNLIRYFATECDDQFTYIAIELAEMTLADYIDELKKGAIDSSSQLDKIDLLKQACSGLHHLHSFDIVHRDIKPANILISSISSGKNDVQRRKIMITDFGVSKILSSESMSTADNRSAGTEGWIAPEILKRKVNGENEKPSKPNDIFSMGCLIYFTHTDGEHPFGNLLNRQTAILNGQADLSRLNSEDDICLRSLVEPMIDQQVENRPPIDAIVKHPYFWNEQQSLQFMQDVSDRFECEQSDSELLRTLEHGSLDVCRGDWRRCITIELQDDLRKFRSYRGQSVRDLLRAIRNKRHHYHELDARVQRSLGSIPIEFSRYFTRRFPRLIIHSYIALQSISKLLSTTTQQQPNDQINSQPFRFKPLPRATVRWNERWKNEDGSMSHPFAFNIRQRKKPNSPSSTFIPQQQKQTISTTTTTDSKIESSEPNIETTDSHFYNDVFKM
ncbi:serine/threonine-protein kinase/endoribonuclease IRE1-like protein [Euroglyphus maynei]|uniref:non-specific serine/threonine protein kinase n=1 Tax=Euroglyphus maynei TaxID=6958 RepID=A0A1Y3B8G7_EURMA|nr:serine/threonine-protein kinase/endoribonuclease IRE1-like protein [Euroglyphus maynei]